MAVFLFSSIEDTLIDEQHLCPNELFILAFVPWDSSAQHLVRHAVDPTVGSSAFKSTMPFPMSSDVYH